MKALRRFGGPSSKLGVVSDHVYEVEAELSAFLDRKRAD